MYTKGNILNEIESKLIFSTRLKVIAYFVSISFIIFFAFNITFYNIYLGNIRNVVVDEVKNSVTQNTEYVDLVLKNVENLADAMSTSPQIQSQISIDHWNTPEGLLSIRDNIIFMNTLSQNITGAQSVSLFLKKQGILLTSDYGLISNIDEATAEKYSSLMDRYSKQKWEDLSDEINALYPLRQGDYVTLVRPIYSTYSQTKESLLLINLDRRIFLNYLNLANNMGNMILDEGGSVIADSISQKYKNNNINIKEFIPILHKKSRGNFIRKINGDELAIIYDTSKNTNWKFASFISITEPIQKMTKAKDYIIIFSLANFISLLILLLIVSREMFRPVTKLIRYMKKVENGDFSVHINEQRDDEFGFIYKSFNNMVNRIKYLFGELFEQKFLKKDAELKLMQSQINPHFLHNIFNNMSWLLELRRLDDLEKMMDAVSTYYRTSLNMGNNYICIREHVEQLKSYAQIQMIRFRDKFDCEFDFDEDMMNMKMPNLILQPLLENAICHGVEPSEKYCSIKVTGRIVENSIVVSVEDNGVGIPSQKLEEIYINMNSDTSSLDGNFALVNCHKRIKLYYGDEYGLELRSHENEGTSAIIRIPCDTSANKQKTEEVQNLA